MRKGKFDLDDLADQLAQVEKIGGLGGIMGMLPGMAKMKDQIAAANLDEKIIKRQRAIILSMTPQERRNPDILKASRKKRIAAGSGTRVEDVNRLLKQHRQMADMMKHGRRKRGPMGKWRRCSAWAGRRHAAADAGADRRIAEADGGGAGMRPARRNCRRPPGLAANRRPPAACRGLAAGNCRAACRASAVAVQSASGRRNKFARSARLGCREAGLRTVRLSANSRKEQHKEETCL